MKSKITDELLRRIEITAMVLHEEDKYSEFDLEDIFKKSLQTIRLDMQTLRSMGIEIHSSMKKITIFKKPTIKTLNDLICVYLSLNENDSIRNLSLIKRKYGNSTLHYFVNIIKAINSRKLIKISYLHPSYNQQVERTLTPVTISRVGKTIFLVGLENDNPERVRHYLFERINNFEFTDVKSKVKELPDISEKSRYSWGSYTGGEPVEVKLLFDKDTGEGIKDKFYIDNQKFEEAEDGYIMTLNVNLSYEFISWVMGFGEQVKVLMPKELKDEILHRAKGIIEKYKE